MNQEALLYIVLALNVLYIPAFILLFAKLKEIKYLVDQPVIQRLSSNNKFTPYKFDRSTSSDNKEPKKVKSQNGGHKKEAKSSNRGGRERVRNQRNTRTRGGARQNQGRGTVVANQPADDNASPTKADSGPAPERKERITVAEVASPKAQPEAKIENKPETNGHSNGAANHGRRQLPKQKVEIPESVAQNEPDTTNIASADSHEITHGRRVKMKKAPSFDE